LGIILLLAAVIIGNFPGLDLHPDLACADHQYDGFGDFLSKSRLIDVRVVGIDKSVKRIL
jgi:hypothetical protein